MMSQPEKFIMNEKKKLFTDTVKKVCEKRGMPEPYINFNGCPEESNEMAHYHPESNFICVSERQLKLMDLTEVKRIAIHEVSHLLVQDHSEMFKAQERINSRLKDVPTSNGLPEWKRMFG